LIDDACAAWTQEAHDKSLQVLDEGYCKVMTTNTVIDLIESQSKKPTNVPA
jgi:isochorismate hydrolase